MVHSCASQRWAFLNLHLPCFLFSSISILRSRRRSSRAFFWRWRFLFSMSSENISRVSFETTGGCRASSQMLNSQVSGKWERYLWRCRTSYNGKGTNTDLRPGLGAPWGVLKLSPLWMAEQEVSIKLQQGRISDQKQFFGLCCKCIEPGNQVSKADQVFLIFWGPWLRGENKEEFVGKNLGTTDRINDNWYH